MRHFSIISFCKHTSLPWCSGFFQEDVGNWALLILSRMSCRFCDYNSIYALIKERFESFLNVTTNIHHTADQIEEFLITSSLRFEEVAIFAQKGSESIVSPLPHNQTSRLSRPFVSAFFVILVQRHRKIFCWRSWFERVLELHFVDLFVKKSVWPKVLSEVWDLCRPVVFGPKLAEIVFPDEKWRISLSTSSNCALKWWFPCANSIIIAAH